MKPLKIPESIKIGGFDYTVDMNNESDKFLEAKNWTGSCGYIDKVMQISTKYSPQETSSTFIHEILHASNDVYNMGKIDEEGITNMANGVFQVLEQFGIRFVK